jgi:hypothetical protein
MKEPKIVGNKVMIGDLCVGYTSPLAGILDKLPERPIATWQDAGEQWLRSNSIRLNHALNYGQCVEHTTEGIIPYIRRQEMKRDVAAKKKTKVVKKKLTQVEKSRLEIRQLKNALASQDCHVQDLYKTIKEKTSYIQGMKDAIELLVRADSND